LKELREKAGYSQYTFAAAFGVAQSTVGNWEAGKREPNFDTTRRIAEFFHVSVDYLLGRAAGPASRAEDGSAEESDEEIVFLARKMNGLPPDKREMLLKMFHAAFDAIEAERDE
jgi:transcriptional regulator with XRE-family HTH domain